VSIYAYLVEFNPYKPLLQAGASSKKNMTWIFNVLASINLFP